ncbi:MAG: response regulator [Lachnospiraceae bacterium]|nr:response regulator [Lachnospiraceae bacterium]MBO7363179.1 response regulator [Lachnospiraceae bacterium]MBO7530428.1 response regulator [Lachnospiraceae bacterium]MBP5472193.1 response regulator [Lachnospiraceae bacterium]MBP5702172.1 response regulator [Lachnospiraceae bacterium]
MTRKQVMVIDDDSVMLLLMKNQLEALYDVVTFLSGAEALEELNRTDKLPDLILLDIGMREMDGYEVLGRLKASEKLKMIPVVFLTGMTDEVSECRGLEMDVVDYLKKPVAGKVLFARVQHYIELYSDVENKGKLDESLITSIPDPLTERELETARLMAEFRSDREICDILHISMPYTKKLVASVKEKLGLEKRGDIRRFLA